MKRKTLTVRDTAISLGCSLKWVRDLLYAGRFPGAKKIGRQWRIPGAAVEQRMKQREVTNG